jgi:hypothetical protein
MSATAVMGMSRNAYRKNSVLCAAFGNVSKSTRTIAAIVYSSSGVRQPEKSDRHSVDASPGFGLLSSTSGIKLSEQDDGRHL